MTAQAELLERAALVDFPMVVAGGDVVQGRAGWTRVSAQPGLHGILEAQLAEAEGKANAAVEREQRWAREDAEREARLVPDEALIGQARIEAEAARQEYVSMRPERIESLLIEIRNLLAKR